MTILDRVPRREPLFRKFTRSIGRLIKSALKILTARSRQPFRFYGFFSTSDRSPLLSLGRGSLACLMHFVRGLQIATVTKETLWASRILHRPSFSSSRFLLNLTYQTMTEQPRHSNSAYRACDVVRQDTIWKKAVHREARSARKW